MEFIIIIIFAGICFYAGWKTREWQAYRIMDKMIEDISEKTVDEFRSKVINIRVEDHDGQFFVYKKDDGSYLAHGETKTKLEDILQEKFPGKFFNASPEDLEKLETR